MDFQRCFYTGLDHYDIRGLITARPMVSPRALPSLIEDRLIGAVIVKTQIAQTS